MWNRYTASRRVEILGSTRSVGLLYSQSLSAFFFASESRIVIGENPSILFYDVPPW